MPLLNTIAGGHGFLMDNYRRYSHFIVRSVDHIFKTFLGDATIEEVFDTQSSKKDPWVVIEIEGTISGELVINLPHKTLDRITRRMLPDIRGRSLKKYRDEVAGELANMITGTFVNQLQFLKHNVRLSPPEFNEDPLTLKTFYENINLSFRSCFGGFDVDLYYRDNR